MITKTVTVRISREAWRRVTERSLKDNVGFCDALDFILAEGDKKPPAPPPAAKTIGRPRIHKKRIAIKALPKPAQDTKPELPWGKPGVKVSIIPDERTILAKNGSLLTANEAKAHPDWVK